MEVSRKKRSVPPEVAMVLLFPLKPVVLVLSLLGGLMLVSFLGASLLEGKQPFVTRGEARKIIVKQNTSRPTLEHNHPIQGPSARGQ